MNEIPIGVIDTGRGEKEELFLDASTGEIYADLHFADGSKERNKVASSGGIDPKALQRLVGEKTSVVGATYGEVELSEFEEEMRGRNGLVIYHKMLTDSTVSQVFNYQSAVMSNTNWRVVPADNSEGSLRIAAFVADQLGINDMKAGKYAFHRLLNLFRLSRIYRRSYGELVFGLNSDGLFALDKIIPIHPLTVEKIVYDNKGGLKSILQRGQVRGESGVFIEKEIPIWKTITFTNNDDGVGEGESALRPGVLHWRIKRALIILMNQGLERFSLGIPKISVPPTVIPSTPEWEAARQICIDFVTRPRMGVIVPQGYDFSTVEITNAMPELIPYLEYHDSALMRSLGVEFSTLGSKEGQYIPAKAQMVITQEVVQAMLRDFCSAVNLYLIPKVVGLNWPEVEKYPRLYAEPDSTEDMAAVANLFGMVLNAASDVAISSSSTRFQVAAMGTSNASRSEKMSTQSNFSDETEQLLFYDFQRSQDENQRIIGGSLEELQKHLQGSGGLAGIGDPRDAALRVQLAMQMLVMNMPTKIRRALGYLEDEQTYALDKYRKSTGTPRKG